MSDKRYATCKSCGQEMSPGTGCKITHYMRSDDLAIKRVPVYAEAVCHDCNAPVGSMHHPGCDMEQCTLCGGQLISCDCDS